MIFLIGFGGLIGTVCRFYLGKYITSRSNIPFPLGTWVINLTGSLFLGVLYALHANHVLADWVWLFLGTGVCGAYTTFSTFGFETYQLIEKNNYRLATTYVVTSVLFGLLFAWIGMLSVSLYA